MKKWNDYYSILRCLHCGGVLHASNISMNFKQYDLVNGELFCHSCSKSYPVFQDIPVMFRDNERTHLLIDSAAYATHLTKAKEKMQQVSQLASEELNQFENEKNLTDALSWEIFFSERWKQKGYMEYSREEIEEYLQKDSESGGKLLFFNKILANSKNTSDKLLLNVGAGRDFLLEKLIEKGFKVIEQDIVLESLLSLKKRKANFCVCCDARTLPFEDNTFDVLTCFGVLHHIWPIEEPVAEVLRVTSGNIHFNESNSFALTTMAKSLPMPIKLKRKLRQWYKSGTSPSPYEHSINPFLFKKIIKNKGAEIIDFSFPKATWIPENSKGLKRIIRTINLMLVNIFPLFSNCFEAVVKK